MQRGCTMSTIFENLEPARVLYYFEKICSIPHGSGNTAAISDYLKSFGVEHRLETYQDEVGNIIIIKEASDGYENEPGILLQGHMDMVAVSRPELNMDMTKEGLKLAIDGDKIYAEGTSLGGDDGIAVAYGLALLEDEALNHPRLELLITVDEEVGMDGARVVDLSMCKANRLLNLDSEDEGIFLTGCAGGARVTHLIPMETVTLSEEDLEDCKTLSLKIDGLKGGHSGCEIHTERGNANKLMGRLLYEVSRECQGMLLTELSGGVADNAIPAECTATLLIPVTLENNLKEAITTFRGAVKEELSTRDPGFNLETKWIEQTTPRNAFQMNQALLYLISVPNGVQNYSQDVAGLVETSLNLGIMKLSIQGKKAFLQTEFAVRSSIESAKEELFQKLYAVATLAGGNHTIAGNYPGWAYRKDSPLREKMIRIFEEMYGAAPKVEAIHAGLECGLLGSKIEDLDCVSIGPDMSNIHSFNETLSLSSTKRVYEFIRKVIETKD